MNMVAPLPTPDPVAPLPGDAAMDPPRRPLRDGLRAFAQSLPALIGAVVLGLILFVALFAPWIAPQNPYDLMQLDITNSKLPPGSEGWMGEIFLLGTDDQGRDILSGIFYGLRSSLAVGLISVVVAVAIGTLVGLLAAYSGGWVDSLLMRIVDLQLSFPTVLVALILLSILGQGIDKVIIALVIVQWAYYARLIRGVAIIEKEKDYVEAARCLRLSYNRIVLGHIARNCMSPLAVTATVQIASAISLEATLSFLGVGMPVTQPSLGLLISNGFKYMLSGHYWISVYPGVALFLLIASINLIGDRLREITDPKASQ